VDVVEHEHEGPRRPGDFFAQTRENERFDGRSTHGEGLEHRPVERLNAVESDCD
jgi:hypothetical protein